MKIKLLLVTSFFFVFTGRLVVAQPLTEVIGGFGEQLGAHAFCDGSRLLFGVPGVPVSSFSDVGEFRSFVPAAQANSLTVPYPITATGAGERFGSQVVLIGDINNDFQSDIAASAPGAFSGQVHIFTNPQQFPALIINGTQTFEGFGTSLSPLGDLDADGVPEMLISAPSRSSGFTNDGAVIIYNIAAQSSFAVVNGQASGEQLGKTVLGLEDYNGDGRPDFAAAAPNGVTGGGTTGLVRIYSSSVSPVQLMLLSGSEDFEQFGASIAAVGDLNADGHGEFLVGAPNSSINGTDSGRAVLFSGAAIASGATNPITLCVLSGVSPGELFGSAVQGIGDTDGNGRREFAIGAPGANQNAGQVRFFEFDGANCPQVRILQQGFGGAPVADDRFGSYIAGVGARPAGACDFNSDGLPDYSISSAGSDTSNSAGRIGLYVGQQLPTPTPTPVPPQAPGKAKFDFKIDERGRLEAIVRYSSVPAPQCTATLYARVYSSAKLSKVTVLDTEQNLAQETRYIVSSVPKVFKAAGEKKPVAHLMVRTNCGNDRVDSNVFARFLNCGNSADPVSGNAWLELVQTALESGQGSSIKVLNSGKTKKTIKASVKRKKKA